MAAHFLTTAALHIYVLWKESPLSVFIASGLVTERWVSPLSHAIIKDTLITNADKRPMPVVRHGLHAVEQHQREMQGYEAQHPYPNAEAIRIWSRCRSVDVQIPAYDDGIATYPVQVVGPDELLVFATAASLNKPLIGPAPTDGETLRYLADVGIRFASFASPD